VTPFVEGSPDTDRDPDPVCGGQQMRGGKITVLNCLRMEVFPKWRLVGSSQLSAQMTYTKCEQSGSGLPTFQTAKASSPMVFEVFHHLPSISSTTRLFDLWTNFPA